jgi:hypothetical protein
MLRKKSRTKLKAHAKAPVYFNGLRARVELVPFPFAMNSGFFPQPFQASRFGARFQRLKPLVHSR